MKTDAKKKIDLEQVIDELQQTNDFLVEINKNLAKMVAFHQLQLVALTEAYFVSEEDLTNSKKIIH
jgi:hypothetical protein